MVSPHESSPDASASASALKFPEVDPTPIFEAFRGSYGTELLTAAVTHFKVFDRLAGGGLSFCDLREAMGLEERPAVVMLTVLRAFGLVEKDDVDHFQLSAMAREHLVRGGTFDVSGYIGLASESPGVQTMIERLVSNKPPGTDPDGGGAAFIYREGMESAMEKEASARSLTLALAGRAKNVAPVLAARLRLAKSQVLLDVGGGTGIYSIACLQKNPHLKAIVWDRPEVLKVAREMSERYGVEDRMECRAGDMFADPLPEGGDTVLLSNVLHDWDVPENRVLVKRCAEALPEGGRLLIHEVYLNDAMDGPLPIALYSAALFSLTEGRAYSGAEYRSWLVEAGLTASAEITPTLVHCGVLEGKR